MKIVYVCNSTSLHGGGSKSFKQLLFGLISKGVEPLVIFPNNRDLYQEFVLHGINCLVVNHRYSTYPELGTVKNRLLFIPRLFFRCSLNVIAYHKLLKIIRKTQPDLIHSNVSVDDIGYKVAKKCDTPHIWHIREYGNIDFNLYHIPTLRSFSKKITSQKSFTICITKDIQKHYKLDKQKQSTVIYNGILHSNYFNNNLNKDSYFLYVGRLTHKKGVGDLIEAFNIFHKHSNTKFILKISGSGELEYDKYLKDRVKELCLDDKVEFLDTQDDIHTLMANATATIVPSHFEGFGRVAAEAMFNNSLVIGRDTGGTKEQFDNGLNLTGGEIALRFTNIEELADRLSDVVNNGVEHYIDIIQRAQFTVRKLYSTEAYCDNVYCLYKDIINTDKIDL